MTEPPPLAPDHERADQNPAPRSPAKILARPGMVGLAVALVFVWQSFSPTLMPRSWVAQGAITGICAAIGYSIGTLAATIGSRVLERTGRTDRAVSPRVRRGFHVGLAVGAAAITVIGVVGWPQWQNNQRALMAMEPISRWTALPVLLLAAIVAVLLGLGGRAVGRGVVALNRFTHRRLPGALATPATVLLVLVLAGFLLQDVVGSWLAGRANSAFGIVDTETSEGTVQPTSELVSGSPASLAGWETLGRQGRDFVAQATPVDTLRAFHGPAAEVTEPIRVYTGLRSADTATERAELAVAELRRTGAFDREVLVVTTVTGTGWVDPDAAIALETLHRGDTAIVAMQYSYLPSWISTILDDGNATEAGAVLYDAVHTAWQQLDPDRRPQLLVFGQSLGSYGAEAAFVGPDARTSVANLVARADGALFTGPTNDNVMWRQLTGDRDPGSPVWRPVIQDGVSVRFANVAADLVELDPDWAGPRILYVQHPSDPVTFWGMDWLWSKPEWLDRPRGADVATDASWFPVVTWVQGVFDLMAGFGAPPGHGHDYRLAFAGAWAQVSAPEAWTSADTERLAEFLRD